MFGRKAIEPGDVFEVKTRMGLAYGQVTHLRKEYGALVRMLKGFHATRPEVGTIIGSEVAFKTFFPLKQAVRAGIALVVGKAAIPKADADFPLFRAAGLPDRSGRVTDWWLWDGEREWKAGPLTPDLKRLPIRGAINDTLLIEWLETGWSPEMD